MPFFNQKQNGKKSNNKNEQHKSKHVIVGREKETKLFLIIKFALRT